MIEITNLHKYYGKLEVLKGIDQHIAKGEVVSIIGPSGSGKSTFLRCINLLEQPTEGEIRIAGESITAPGACVDKLRQKVGMVFQHFNLFPHKTVLANLTLAPVKLGLMSSAEAEARLWDCWVRLAWQIRKMPIHPVCPAARNRGWPLPEP